ncbi:hypothetical protein [Stappia indica]|uniref:Alpha/beta hydrolase family protein n=1 Tax=Stappia indica TaxID=538381 RepID=A0A285R5A3_9HYPH|nr:hypothetical protein [Stappia indica]SOB89280.1 hypothetical protein SAMN05421512_101189 [Stappia indica]
MVVTFANWIQPGEPRLGFGHGFLASLGYRAIHIVPERNDWYQSDTIEAAVSTARALVGQDFALGYGASMGAFGLANFGDLLDLNAALLFSPQYSIDTNAVPFEWRWKEEAKELSPFPRHRIPIRPQKDNLKVYYDSELLNDVKHVDLIEKHLTISRVECPGAGHNILGTWYKQGRLAETVTSAIETTVNSLTV